MKPDPNLSQQGRLYDVPQDERAVELVMTTVRGWVIFVAVLVLGTAPMTLALLLEALK